MSATHRSRLPWVCLEAPRRLLWPGRGVSPKHIKIGFGCNGLGLLPLWFLALYQLGFVTKLRAFDSCFSGFSLPGLRLQDVLEPDAVLIELALQAAHHCLACVFVRRDAQLVL